MFISRFMNISPIQRQSMMVFGSTIFITLAGFLSTVYFARVLGPAPLGAYFLFLAYYGVFNLLGDGGFGGSAVKRISEGKDQDEYFSAFVVIRVILLAFTITILLCAEPWLKDLTSSGIFFWLLLALVMSVFPNCVSSGVYGSGKVGIHQICVIIELVVRVLLQITAVYIGYSIAGLAGGFVGGVIAGGIVNFRYLDQKLVRFSLSHVKNLSTFSFWIFLTSSGSLIFSYTDTILIGFYLNNTEVGIYRTALQLASVGSFATLAFQTVLYPKISSWAAHGQVTDIEKALARSCTYSLFLAVPACVGGWILGESLLYYLYGASFIGGAIPLVFLLLIQVVNIFMFLGTMSLNALDHPRDAFIVTAVAALVNIVLNIVFIPMMGITGAAVATLIAIAVNAIGAYILLSRVISLKIEYQPIKHILCAASVMGIFLLGIPYFLPLTHIAMVIATVITGAGIYALVLLKLDREIHDEILNIGVSMGVPWPEWF
jgi:O-antigen/teichoic acid export membrane protein